MTLKSPPKQSQMHGDLVHALAATACARWYTHKAIAWYHRDADLVNPPIPSYVPWCLCLGMAGSACVCYYSWINNHCSASAMAFAVATLTFAGIDVYNWPQPEDNTAVNRFVWLLLICTANQPHSFASKMIMGVGATIVYTTVSAISPLYTTGENVPIMFACFAVYTLIHYEAHWHNTRRFDSVAAKNAHTRDRDRFRVHVATLLLIGFFAYYETMEMIDLVTKPELAKIASFNIVRAGIIGAIGLVAAGAFCHELDTKEELEALVEQRAAKIAQQAAKIHQQEDDLRQAGMALKASETAVVITDQHGSIQWFNPALQRLTGQAHEIVRSKTTLEDALCPSDDDKKKLNRCFQDAGSAEDEIVVYGKIVHVQVSLSPSTQDSKEPIGNRFVVVLKDITESRALEEAQRVAQEEALISKAMIEAMETLTHELRTPLQGIMGMTSSILDTNPEALPSEIKEPLAIVMVSSRLLLTLINNILDVRKCDANMMNEFELSAVPVKPALTDAVNFCQPLATMSGVQLQTSYADADAESAIVLSHNLRIQQVGINLVANAIKYTPTGRTVHIHTSIATLTEVEEAILHSLASGEHQEAWNGTDVDPSANKGDMKVLVVSVMDQGQGIDESMKAGLFRKFTRLGESHQRVGDGGGGASTTSQPSGSGLGLNLCRKFVHRMKGNIWASNNNASSSNGVPEHLLCGASFSFYLPIHVDDDDVSQDETSSRAEVESDVMLSPSKLVPAPVVFADYSGLLAPLCSDMSELRVLGVDDIAINLKVLDRMLKLCGVGTIRLVKSGEEAMSILEKEFFDLVISDLQMPGGMSGTELSAAIRDSDLAHKPVVVGLTAEVSPGVDRRCAASGMTFLLHKPVTMSFMKDFINKLLNAGHISER